MVPYHFYTGFSKYCYQHHMPLGRFQIQDIMPNRDCDAQQQITRLGGLECSRGNWRCPLACVYSLLGLLYFKLRTRQTGGEALACFDWHCMAVRTRRNA
jgi:hypothetical protein